MKTALHGVVGAALPVLLLLAQRAQDTAGVSVELNGVLVRSYAEHTVPSSSSSAGANGGFFTATSEPLPASLLMTVNGYYGDPSDSIACSVAETKRETTKNATVLLALSKCLNESSLNLIESWVADMKDKEYTFLQDGVGTPIEFATAVVPGCCQERNKHELEGRAPPSIAAASTITTTLLESSTASLFLSEEVLQGDMERFTRFARFGRVLGALPNPLNEEGEESERAISVISVVNNARSYDEVEQFERKFKVRKAFNFQLCERGENNCKGKFENCIFLHENVDLMLYSPFTVTHAYQCEDGLEGGIPVSSVTKSGERQCFCTCPAGFEIQQGANSKKFCVKTQCETPAEPSCSWNTHPFGFKHEVATKLSKCKLSKIASDWGVPVPFPSDNYVADARVNSHDSDSKSGGPRVKVSVKKLPSEAFDGARLLSLSALGDTGLFERKVPPPTVIELLNLFAVGDVSHHLRVLPAPNIVALRAGDKDDEGEHSYTWKDYQSHRRDAIDDLAFASYGKYSLTLDASDYASNATCTGCLAIVDKFRPRATHQCPSALDTENGNNAAELSTPNVKKVDNLIQQFFQFGDDAENDACSDNDSSNQRCDTHVWQKQDFWESSYSDVKTEAEAKKVFDDDEVRSDLHKALASKKNPLAKASDQTCANQETTPVNSGQCKRCVKLSTALKELWTDYTCNYEYDVQKCEGDANQTCAFEQCLVVNGDSLATAVTKVKSDAAKTSKALGATSGTEIRRELASGCPAIGKTSACQFKSKLFKLIEISANASSKSVLSDSDATKFVFWRYRVKSNGEWKLWQGSSSSSDDEAFAQETTKVFLEAWTSCGLVAEFKFTVVLVLPKSSSSYGSYAFSTFSSLLNGGATGNGGNGEDGVATGSLVALCSLVALVVVVVAVAIQRRRSSAEKATSAARVEMADDAYHPLLQY